MKNLNIISFLQILFLIVKHVKSQDAMVERITSQELFDGMRDGRFDVVIDVRGQSEWDAGHIDGATFLEDLNMYDTAAEKSKPEDLMGCEECTIAIYCFSGARAGRAANILAEAGFSTPIYNGLGVLQWQAAGYPLANTPSVVAPCQEGQTCGEITSEPTATPFIESLAVEEFYDGIQNGRFDVIVDVRSNREWEAGHIDGATHLEDLNLFETDDEKSSPADLAGCEECNIAVYCHSGSRAMTAIQILVDAGFNTPIYNGLGVSQWQAAGYPLVNTPSVVAPCQEGLSCAGDDEGNNSPFGNLCFSGENNVEVLGKGTVLMKELKVDDFVKVRDGKYDRVYTFGHRDELVSSYYLQFLPSLLEISHDHMIFVENRGPISASAVVVGDIFVDGGGIVEAIREVKRIGAFAPFTTSGTIIVNAIVSSNYIAFQDSSVIKIGPKDTIFTYQWVAHTFLAPYRIWSNAFVERSEKGNDWIIFGYKVYKWLLSQNPTVLSIILIPLMAILAIFGGIEALLSHWSTCNIFLISLFVAGFIVELKRKKISNK